MNFNTHILKLKTRTWARDSYGLFDYETSNHFSHSFDIEQPGYLMRDGNEVFFVDQKTYSAKKNNNHLKSIELLAHITDKEGIN